MSQTSRYDDDERGQEQWKARTEKASEECWDLLSALRANGFDQRACLNVAPEVKELAARVSKYRGCIEMKMPVSGHDGPEPFEDWDEQLLTVDVPQAGTYDGGMTNVYGEFSQDQLFQNLEWTRRPVNLATLEREWARDGAVTVEVEVDNGTKTVAHTFQPTLPIIASAACIRQIDRVVEDIGWVPPAREKPIHAEVLE